MSRPNTSIRGFLSELKRRRVFRVAAVYAAVAFIIAQVAALLQPALLLPDWVYRLVVFLLLLGFPVALVLAWAFDITPEGVRLTERADVGPERRDVSPAGMRWSTQRIGAVGGVLVLAFAGGAFVLFGGSFQRATAPLVDLDRSIAVLPFADLSEARDQEYFSDGITEDILTHLSHIADLKVIARTSVMRYKGSGKSAREIGHELGVATILEGSVRRAGDRLRVSAKLIRADTDQQLWAESYDRQLTDIFEIQSEVARQIANALQARLSPGERERLTAAQTGNLTAYDYHLRGREHIHRLSRSDVDRGIAFLRQAIAVDPDYALAHAELSFAFTSLDGYHGAGLHWLDSAYVAASKAIELDPNVAEGYRSLAEVHWNRGQLAEAVETYRQVLDLRPNDPRALWGLAFTRWMKGELGEALRLLHRAVEVDPAAPLIVTLLGRCYASLGDAATAERWYRRALQLQPDFPWAHQDLLWMFSSQGQYVRADEQLRMTGALMPGSRELLDGTAFLALRRGDYAAARDAYEQLRQREGGANPPLELGFVYSKLGKADRAQEIWKRSIRELTPLVGVRRQVWWHFPSLARAHAGLGEREEALRWLEEAFSEGWRGYPVIDIADDPLLESLHAEPRFQRLRREILADVERMRRQAEREGRR